MEDGYQHFNGTDCLHQGAAGVISEECAGK